MLVRSLVPGSAPGNTMEDIVTARMNYARLDDPASKVRIRLNSTAVHVKHVGDPQSAKEVEVTYVRGGQARRVRAASCVLACYNMVIPYLCPEMPDKQKEALAYAVKIPLVYTNVQIRNWKSFQKLGLSSIYAPGAYFSNIALDYPGLDGRIQLSGFARRTVRSAFAAHSLQTGAALQRSVPRRAMGTVQHEVRNLRAAGARSIGPHALCRRIRSRHRHRSHHGQPVAARICLRIQPPVRTAGSARIRSGLA